MQSRGLGCGGGCNAEGTPEPGSVHGAPAVRRERRIGKEAQLRAKLELIQQQTTQAKTQLQELQQQRSQIQDSACNLSSVVSGKFSRLLQALELRRISALRDIEAGKTQVLAPALEVEQRLQGHLEDLAQYGQRVQELLEKVDDQTFFQELQQLSEPPEPFGPLTPVQWDEDQQLGTLKELLSLLCGLLLKEETPPKVPAKTADLDPVEAPDPLVQVPSMMCPVRRKLWQNYRNLTFDPDSANHHFSLSCQDRRVKHCCQPQGPARPDSFALWQVQCAQSFQGGHHYWEVRTSDHSVTLGVAYPELARQKRGTITDNIGQESCSWGLCIQENGVLARHNGDAQHLPPVSARLLGMDLDLDHGSLSFYSLEPQARLLHTFHALFSRPLCPVFWLLEGRTLTLCHRPRAQLPPAPQAT
ncbi:tripartite motif-containing protein 65 isoform X2 [Octodon degus]|uniref:Tripartite motif-containing protein 65 isoform X2 n=1 Tax=Octodon degus TaxID=10160 RepID=A0A6P6EBT2_OCTDE|nr:tripartite motif-containing protein 65 isoform X2 [Octodon degus]